MTGRIAFVPPRFGPGVVGGAEAVCREAALGLASRGWDVEILTTCAIDHYTWVNDLPEGVTEEEGLVVRRWKMVHDATRAGLRAQRQIERGELPALDAQISWISLRFQVPGLFHELLRHGTSYDAIVFAPYMFWTSTVCLPIVAERAVAMPCLHDETYARLDVVRPVLGDAAGLWFLSEPEHELAHRLGPVAPRHRVIGAGVDVPGAYDAPGFRARHGLRRPFVLYAGRREPDKGWPWLLDTYARAVELGGIDVDLVTAGVGEVSVPDAVAGRVIDLGFLPDAERDDAFAAAAASIQPSRMESFSRTTMESWLAGTPVLAVEQSEVVAWHCERGGGGLTFRDEFDLAECLRWLVQSPGQAAAMAERGRRYVVDNYAWPVVLDRMEADLEELRAAVGGPAGYGPARRGTADHPAEAAGQDEVMGVEGPAPGWAGQAHGRAGQSHGRAGGDPDPPVLVVGSYPPVTGAPAEATLDAVRRAYAAGSDVVVVSPRHGAAPRTMRVAGPGAGVKLDGLRVETGARHLVFCAEPGLPFPVGGGLGIPVPSRLGRIRLPTGRRRRLAGPGPARRAKRDRQTRTAQGLAPALGRFERVTLVVTADLGVAPEVLAPLWSHVDEVLVPDDPDPVASSRALGAPAGLVSPVPVTAKRVGVGSPGDSGLPAPPATGAAPPATGADPAVALRRRADVARFAAARRDGHSGRRVTLFGPPEVLPRERPRQIISITARTVLGPFAPVVRGRLAAAVRSIRSVLH